MASLRKSISERNEMDGQVEVKVEAETVAENQAASKDTVQD